MSEKWAQIFVITVIIAAVAGFVLGWTSARHCNQCGAKLRGRCPQGQCKPRHETWNAWS